MILNKVYIKGFRNFKEVTVNFNKHSLIFGANDVGKTNLIYALRILLDRGFSDYDYELKDSDFFYNSCLLDFAFYIFAVTPAADTHTRAV